MSGFFKISDRHHTQIQATQRTSSRIIIKTETQKPGHISQTSENQRQRGKFEGNHKTKTYFLQENNKKEDYSGFIVK